MFIFLFIYVFFGSDFSLICVFTPFYVLFGTVSRLHAKSASLKWSICRSVLFKLMVTLICCFCSLAIGDCASMFLKVYVSVFHYPLVKKSLVTMCLCMYFQDNLIFEDRIIWGCLWGGAALLILPHVLSFVLRLIDWFIHASVFVPLPIGYLHLVSLFTASAPLHGPKSICIVHDYARTSSAKHEGSRELVTHTIQQLL